MWPVCHLEFYSAFSIRNRICGGGGGIFHRKIDKRRPFHCLVDIFKEWCKRASERVNFLPVVKVKKICENVIGHCLIETNSENMSWVVLVWKRTFNQSVKI